MALLGDFGSLAGGLSQGMQAGADLRAKALQIQQYQMVLDAAKRDLAAKAAIFGGQAGAGGIPPNQGMGGQSVPGQPPQTGVPPMPGQASVPRPQPQGGPPGGMPPPGPAMQGAPQMPPQAPPQGAPPPTLGGPQGPRDMTAGAPSPDQFDPVQVMMRIAADIKQRNPNLDPLTLADAVGQTIDLMKGIQPDMRAQMQYLLGIMKTQQAGADTGARVGAEVRGQDIRAATTERGQDLTHDARIAAVNATIRDTDARIQDADRRTTFTQNQITQRFNAGLIPKGVAKAQRDILGAANAQYRTAKDRYNSVMANVRAGVLQPTDPSVQKAADDAGRAAKNLQDVTAKIAKDSTAAPLGGASEGNIDAAIANAPTDKDALAIADRASAALNAVPSDLPDPKGKRDGTKAKDDKGKVVAVIKGGKWVKP